MHELGMSLGQLTLRIRNVEKSLHFYQSVLGMRLLSRQRVEPYRFTLYFLAFVEKTDEVPPCQLPDGSIDINAVGNREWLWQRPYTTLELQHRDGGECYAAPADGDGESYTNHMGE